MEYSLDKVNFLDVEVIWSGNKLLTNLYVKPTDTHQYLEFSSCHIYHSKKSIPYSQAFRFNRICSENIFFNNRCQCRTQSIFWVTVYLRYCKPRLVNPPWWGLRG